MKLWLLLPIRGIENDPWNPWYDKCFGLVIRAETEEIARGLASKAGGDENRETSSYPWTNQEQSTCCELTADGEQDVILTDFRSA